MISQTHRLDVVPGGVTAVVHVKQYQTGESLVFELFSRFGDFEISAEYTECTVRGTKSDGNGYSANATCDPSNNSVTVELTEQMTAVAGRQPYEITITESTGRMITTTFVLDVHRAALDADTVESESVIREVQTIVEEYIEDHPGLFVVDPTLTQSGEAADAKVTGDAIADLQSAISGGTGLSAEAKAALLSCFQNVAWINDDGQTYYDTLYDALYPPQNLVSISAVYTQTGVVYSTDSLDSLKPDLVVTATYEDSSTAVITTYTLSGTLTAGTSTITASYGGKTDTFTVTVTSNEKNFVEVGNPVINNKILEKSSTNTGYIRTNQVFSPGSSTWNIKFKFKWLTNGGTYQDIIDAVDSSNTHVRSIMLEGSNGILRGYFASSGAASWDIDDGIHVFSEPSRDTDYYIDVYYDGTKYGYKLSTDGQSWTDHSRTVSNKLIAGGSYIAFGKALNGEFNGEIDLSTLQIYIAGAVWWQAYGEVADVSSISAAYTQSSTVYTNTSLDSLKSDLVVTATYSDATTRTLSDSEYTLSGTLTEGTSTVTVTYSGKTTTFTVTVTAAPSVHTGYTEVGSPTITSNILTVADGKFVKTNELFSPGDDTWAVRCKYKRTESLGSYADIFGGVDSSNASVRTLLLEASNATGTNVSLFLSSNNSSWDISGTGAVTLPNPTSWVWAEIAFDGSNYTLKYSTDGTTWTTAKTVASTAKITGGYAVGFGLKRNGYLKGEIDLTGCEIYVAGALWWKAIA